MTTELLVAVIAGVATIVAALIARGVWKVPHKRKSLDNSGNWGPVGSDTPRNNLRISYDESQHHEGDALRDIIYLCVENQGVENATGVKVSLKSVTETKSGRTRSCRVGGGHYSFPTVFPNDREPKDQ